MTCPSSTASAPLVPRPPMPSITASAVLESRLFIASTRRVLAAWIAAG